jgi:hypothetical protein
MSGAPDEKRLKKALQEAPGVPFVGAAFRAIPGSDVIRNLTFDHLWAGNSPGRCNPAGIARLHLSLEKKTAEAEFRHHMQKAGMDADLAECHSFAVTVKLARVLDLTDGKTRRMLKDPLKEILLEWESDPLGPPNPHRS